MYTVVVFYVFLVSTTLSLQHTPFHTSTYVRASNKSLRMNDDHFDYLVIGGGSGGVASARKAAGYGAKVAICEKSALGGTCVNVGCVPKKVMFNAASVFESIHQASQFGITVDGFSLDWLKLKGARDAYVKRLNDIYLRVMINNKIRVYEGKATFVSPNEIEVGGKRVTANNILIAVGGRPAAPRLPGVEHCITSDGFFALEKQPRSVAVVGGGYIGVELAGVFQGLGTATTLLTLGDRPLPSFDTLITNTLLSEMKKQGIDFKPNTTTKEIVKHADGTLTIVTETEILGPFDQVRCLTFTCAINNIYELLKLI